LGLRHYAKQLQRKFSISSSAKIYSQEQKLKILESAEKLGVRPAADIAGIHNTTVCEWRNQLIARGKLNHLSLEQKQKVWELIEQFLNPITSEKSVTLFL